MRLLSRWWASRRRASRWFVRLQTRGVDSHTDKAFVRWLASDSDNETALETQELTWALANELRDRARINELLLEADRLVAARSEPSVTSVDPPRRTDRVRTLWGVGCATAALAGIAALALYLNQTPLSPTVYQTAVAEQRHVTLPDGSEASLNTLTAIGVTYTRSVRRVDLMQGEAVFLVQKDASRAFQVHARGGVSTAVGTQFDVEVRGEKALVSVLEGAVTVQSTIDGRDAESVKVATDQVVDYAVNGPVSNTRRADVERIRGWQAHRIVFSDTPLAEAVRDYNRYARFPILLAVPTLAERRIHGEFRIGDEDAFLRALEEGLPLRASRGQTNVTLVPR